MNKEPEVKMSEIQITRGNEFLHALEPYGQVQVVREMSRRIQALDKNEIKLNGGEAAHLAQLAVSHDLNPFSGEIWGWVQKKKGERHFNWMPGRRGIIRHANEQSEEKGSEWWSDERALTEHEKVELVIPKDALAFESKVFETSTMDPWRKTFNALIEAGVEAKEALKIAGNPPCSVGIGVLTRQEISYMPKNNKMPHANRAKKRALMEALKGKFSLHFGGAAGGSGGETFEDYIVDSKGAIDVDFEDVTESRPFGMDDEAFGGKERLDPKEWKGICEKMVKAELARDPFVAAELLAYSMFTPTNINEEWALNFFNFAKEIFIEDENQELKDVAELAYSRLFETDKEKKSRTAKKPVPKKAQAKKKPTPKKETPTKPDLTKKEANALVRMAEDYPNITPQDKLDWNTAYKYIDLKESGTDRKAFVKTVNDKCKGDVRLGMALQLGYLD